MDVERCRDQFPSLGRVVGGQPVAYFDGPGGTQVPARGIDVAVGWAANSVGTVNDLAAVRAWTREAGALLVVDAVHWVPHGVVDVAALDPDFLLCSAYKFFGPHVGVLCARPGALERLAVDKVRPQRDRAPERIETGTLNHAALAGVTAAVEFIADLVPDHGQPPRQRLDDGGGAGG